MDTMELDISQCKMLYLHFKKWTPHNAYRPIQSINQSILFFILYKNHLHDHHRSVNKAIINIKSETLTKFELGEQLHVET
jgi:hypothetical protein